MGFGDLAKVSGKGRHEKEEDNGVSLPSTSTSTSPEAKMEDVDVTEKDEAEETRGKHCDASASSRVKTEKCSPMKTEKCSPMKTGQWTTGLSPAGKKEVASPSKSDNRQGAMTEVTLKEEEVDIDVESTFTESDRIQDSQDALAVTTLALPFRDGTTTTSTLQGATLIASKSEGDSPVMSGSGEGHVSFPNDASLRMDNISLRPGEALPPNTRFF